MSAKDMIIGKLTSGRFWCVMAFAATVCYLAIIEANIRDAFMALAGGLIRDYFGRNDRPKEENGQGKTGPGEFTESPKQS